MTPGWIGASLSSSARVGWAMTSGGIWAAFGWPLLIAYCWPSPAARSMILALTSLAIRAASTPAYACWTGSTTLMWTWITDWLPDRNFASRSGGATMTVSILRSFRRWSADAGSGAISMTFI